MAVARKCDRCGTFYDNYAHINRIEYYRLCKSGTVENRSYIDLCPACSEEFLKWIKGEENEEQKNKKI